MPSKSAELKAHNKRKFHYSLESEFAIRNVLGDKGYQSASLFASPSLARKLLGKAVNKLEKRADDVITSDERLRLTVMMDFSELKKMIQRVDKEANEISIIATQIRLISHLLGFDWMDGETYRTPIYQRTHAEELTEFRKMIDGGWRALDQDFGTIGIQRFNIAKNMVADGFSQNHVARVLGLTVSGVRRLLAIATADRVSELVSDGKSREEILKIITNELGDSFKAFDDYYKLSQFGLPAKTVSNKK